MQIRLTRFFVISILAIFFSSTLTLAQNERIIYVCVTPETDTSSPYLLQFRGFDLAEVFGVIVADVGSVTVYTNDSRTVSVGLYATEHNVVAGDYTILDELATVKTRSELPTDNRTCEVDFSDLITKELLATIPLVTSPDFMLILNVNERASAEPISVRGAFGFYFVKDDLNFGRNLQIIQLSDRLPQIGLPYLNSANNTDFVLITNKEVSVRRSFVEDPNVFSSFIPSDERTILIRSLNTNNLDLLDIMTQGNLRIFPFHGLISDYPSGGFIQFDVSSSQVLREPQFDPGDPIMAIDGSRFGYDSSDGSGTLNRATVSEINNEGQLLVHVEGQSPVIVLEPWLVIIEQN